MIHDEGGILASACDFSMRAGRPRNRSTSAARCRRPRAARRATTQAGRAARSSSEWLYRWIFSEARRPHTVAECCRLIGQSRQLSENFTPQRTIGCWPCPSLVQGQPLDAEASSRLATGPAAHFYKGQTASLSLRVSLRILSSTRAQQIPPAPA